jgi:hypothetical protein
VHTRCCQPPHPGGRSRSPTPHRRRDSYAASRSPKRRNVASPPDPLSA